MGGDRPNTGQQVHWPDDRKNEFPVPPDVRILNVLVHSRCRIPERTGGHEDLKPGTAAKRACLPDGDTGQAKYLPGEKETHAGIFSKAPFEDLLLYYLGNPGSVVLPTDHKGVSGGPAETTIVIT